MTWYFYCITLTFENAGSERIARIKWDLHARTGSFRFGRAIRNKVVTQILCMTELTHRHTFPSLLTISSPWDSSPSSGRVLFLLIDPVKWPSSDSSFQSKVFSIITNYKWQSLLLKELLCPNLSINQAASQLLHEFHYLELFTSTAKTIKRNLSVQNYTVTLNVWGLKPETESSVEN